MRKSGKRPTLKQKERIAAHKGFDPEKWLVVKDCDAGFVIRHRRTGKLVDLNTVETRTAWGCVPDVATMVMAVLASVVAVVGAWGKGM